MKKRTIRIGFGVIFVTIALAMACSTMVRAGQAAVIARFGKPVRVLTDPGWYFRWPLPIERTRTVDVRLQSTSSGLYSIQMNDGSVIVAETFVLWQVPNEHQAIGTFLRAVDNAPETAATQMRSLLGSGMQSISGGFAVSDLINPDDAQVKIALFEQQLQDAISDHLQEFYGIDVVSVGCERLMVPETIVAATIDAMIEDRNTLAQQERSAGLERAGQIVSKAKADARITVAEAKRKAADIEATAKQEAAAIYANAYQSNPELYAFLRQLDTMAGMLQRQSTLVLRSDAAPFRMLVDGPQASPLPIMARSDSGQIGENHIGETQEPNQLETPNHNQAVQQ